MNVNGDSAIPLFKYLKEKLPGTSGNSDVTLNFEKFLIDKNGQPGKVLIEDDPDTISEPNKFVFFF